MKKLLHFCLILSVINYPMGNLFADTPKPISENIYSDSEDRSDKDQPESSENPEKLVDETQTPSARFPGVLDLSQSNEPEKSTKYTSIALIVFNIVLFTTGMALVKSIVGETI